jgi:hypothetical protein
VSRPPPRLHSANVDVTFAPAIVMRNTIDQGMRTDVDEKDACFIVRDASGQAVAYWYFEHEPGRRSGANLLTHDEARRIASNIAKLPKLPRGDRTA